MSTCVPHAVKAIAGKTNCTSANKSTLAFSGSNHGHVLKVDQLPSIQVPLQSTRVRKEVPNKVRNFWQDFIFCSRFRLDLHMRTHDGRRPFQCPGCAYTCARKDNLASHVRKVHKMELEEASLVYSKDYRVNNIASPRENLKQEDREEDKLPLSPPCVDIDLLDSSSDVLVVLNPLDGFMLSLDPANQ